MPRKVCADFSTPFSSVFDLRNVDSDQAGAGIAMLLCGRIGIGVSSSKCANEQNRTFVSVENVFDKAVEISLRPWLGSNCRKIVVLADGAADLPCAQLNGKTPWEAAKLSFTKGALPDDAGVGLLQTIPPGCSAGSEVANLSFLGYSDEACRIKGRAALEALAIGIDVPPGASVYRCNLANFPPNPLPADLGYLYRGVGYRHIFMPGQNDVDTKALGRRIDEWLQSQGIHEKIKIWSGTTGGHAYEPFVERYGMRAAVVAAVPVIRGIGLALKMRVPFVSGATGDEHTDLAAKVRLTLDLIDDCDFVFLHIEAPDELSHRRDPSGKCAILERIDREVIAPLLAYCTTRRGVSLTIATDHYTDSNTGCHLDLPIPYIYIPPR